MLRTSVATEVSIWHSFAARHRRANPYPPRTGDNSLITSL
jgi:hypothetical protein